jgi:hypothetical protein
MYRAAIEGRGEVAPKKQTRELGLTLLLFELFRTPIAERLMQALAVIEHLDRARKEGQQLS